MATGKKKKLIVNGKNYNTKDGTAVRDFIHVVDLANIHLLSLKYLIKTQHNISHIFIICFQKMLNFIKFYRQECVTAHYLT